MTRRTKKKILESIQINVLMLVLLLIVGRCGFLLETI